MKKSTAFIYKQITVKGASGCPGEEDPVGIARWAPYGINEGKQYATWWNIWYMRTEKETNLLLCLVNMHTLKLII